MGWRIRMISTSSAASCSPRTRAVTCPLPTGPWPPCAKPCARSTAATCSSSSTAASRAPSRTGPSAIYGPLPLRRPLYLERFRHFSSHRSFQLLLSTAHDELASDRLLAKPSQETLGDGQHSPFALALLQALQPHSPRTSTKTVCSPPPSFTPSCVTDCSVLLPAHHQQTPSLWNLDWHDGGEFLFCLGSVLPELPSAAPLSKDFNPYLGLRPFSAAHAAPVLRPRAGHRRAQRAPPGPPALAAVRALGRGQVQPRPRGSAPASLGEHFAWQVPASLRPSSLAPSTR